MGIVELTDAECPECGGSMDRVVRPKANLPEDEGAERKATVRLTRVYVCPECGYTREDPS